jgi:3-methyl-2-oxobutanoate hydroxymethyltransferase
MASGSITISSLRKKKEKGEKITVLTAHDYPFARLADIAGIDCILVSDVLGQVGLGYNTTIPVSLEEIVHHTKAVCKAVSHAFVIAKMPFLEVAAPFADILKSAKTLVKEAGAQALEVEGDKEIIPIVRKLVRAGIPIMPHIGATTQDFMRTGQFQLKGKTAEATLELLDLARSLQDAGAFSIMLECVPVETADILSRDLQIPVFGIGAGAACDGQILVMHDMLGLYEKFVPKFVKVYCNLSVEITSALKEFTVDVKNGKFPGSEHSYNMAVEEFEKIK